VSGETEKDVSGWTVDTLHAHVDAQIQDLKEFANERFQTQKENLRTALSAQDSEFRSLDTRLGDVTTRLSALEERHAAGRDIRAEAKSSAQIALSVIGTFIAVIVAALAIYGALRP